MDPFISNLDAEIDRLRSELAEMVTARKVYLRLRGIPAGETAGATANQTEVATQPEPAREGGLPTASTRTQDIKGKTIREASRIILGESTRAGTAEMHYRDVARIAFERGYESPRSDSNEMKTTRSFFDTMRRCEDEFTRNGAKFRLIDPGTNGHA
jgi:hypothetical protein